MKITYLMRFWPTFGGGETVTRALVNEFAKRGHEVSVIYLWDRTNNIQDYVDENVKTYRLDGITNVADGGIKKIEYAHISQKLKIVFDNIHPEIVVNQWLPTKEVALALKGRDAKLIKCHHGSVRWEPTELVTMKQKIFYGILGEWGKCIRVFPEYLKDYLYSDKWVLLCDGFLKQARRILPFVDDKKLAVIPNPLPYYVEPDEIDIKGKSREILYVGRIVLLKKLPYIIEAWSKIEDQADGWSFRIVGDGDCLSDVKTFASKTNCKRIIFEGYKDSRPFF